MKIRSVIVSALIAISTMVVTPNSAFAFCGVIQESATARTAERASLKARSSVLHQVRKLRRQHGAKLQAQDASLACLGGGVAIDANGNQLVGRPTCTATVAYCVNP